MEQHTPDVTAQNAMDREEIDRYIRSLVGETVNVYKGMLHSTKCLTNQNAVQLVAYDGQRMLVKSQHEIPAIIVIWLKPGMIIRNEIIRENKDK